MSRADEIRERLEAASPGPWHLRYLGHHSVRSMSICTGEKIERDPLPIADVWLPMPWRGGPDEQGGREQERIADATAGLIAHAPEDLAYLLAELASLREERDAALSELDVYAPSLVGLNDDLVAAEARAERLEAVIRTIGEALEAAADRAEDQRARAEAVEAERDETVGNLVVELNRAEAVIRTIGEALEAAADRAEHLVDLAAYHQYRARKLLDSLPGETK